jgi:hypothetical protein
MDSIITVKNRIIKIDLKKVDKYHEIETDEYKITIVTKNKLKEYLELEKYPELEKFIDVPFVYGESMLYNFEAILRIIEIYKNVLNKNVIVFIPKYLNNYFYELINSLEITVHNESMESLEKLKFNKNDKVIFVYSHVILNELSNINKRRLNTILSAGLKKGVIQILSPVLLNYLSIEVLTNVKTLLTEKPNINFNNWTNFVNFMDFDEESICQIVKEYCENNKRVYMCLNLEVKVLKEIEKELNSMEVTTSRVDNDSSDVVINSIKDSIITNNYDVYILFLPKIMDPVHSLNFLKFIGNGTPEILMDESNVRNITKCLKILNQTVGKKLIIKDSEEYSSYEELIGLSKESNILASDWYYSIIINNISIKNMDLSNLKMSDYSIIRNYVKQQLSNKFNIDVNTCQLISPSHPTARYKKLNSLSNKISSIDYRCDCACQVFKNYTIGVVVWNETFSQKKEIKLNQGDIFIYQTTKGTWKYTSIS